LIVSLGRNNVSQPSGEELKATFNEYLNEKQLVVFQEVKNYKQRDVENTLKPLCAAPPDTLWINPKGLRQYSIPNTVSLIFMSNFREALGISKGDGRYFCIWCDAERKPDSYYENLWAWFDKDDGHAKVFNYLLQRDLSGFNAKDIAPATPFKMDLIESSVDGVVSEIMELIKAHESPFHNDMVDANMVKDHFHLRNAQQAGYKLRDAGLMKRELRYREDKKSIHRNVWIVRDFKRYKAMSNEDLVELWKLLFPNRFRNMF
jgi:hypothetical protein